MPPVGFNRTGSLCRLDVSCRKKHELPVKPSFLEVLLSIAVLPLVSNCFPALAQNAPTPGSAPVPGGGQGAARLRAPIGQGNAAAGGGFSYGDLPLNADDAKARILELSNAASTSRPQELVERVDQLSTWLTDMADSHNKMANSFGKHDQTKGLATAERQTAQRFSSLKHQVLLLKAELLINMRRYPEALGPLIDIVTAEPTTETGQSAYKKLQELGFSPETAEAPASSEPAIATDVTAPHHSGTGFTA